MTAAASGQARVEAVAHIRRPSFRHPHTFTRVTTGTFRHTVSTTSL